MMRKLSSIALLLGLALLCATPAAHAISLDMLPGSQSVALGTPVSIDLTISGLGNHAAPSLSTFDLDITFDPAILSFSQVVFGAFLGVPDTDLSPLVSTSSETEIAVDTSTPGILNLVELSFLEGDSTTCIFCIPPYLADLQPSSFTLATLTFDTLATTITPSALILTVHQLGDANGDPLPLSATPAPSFVTVTPQQPGQIPEPTTMTLVGTGVIALLGYSWRQRRAGARVPRL